MNNLLVWLFIGWFSTTDGFSYKVLIIDTMPAKSNYILGKEIAEILHERGHKITFISCFPSNDTPFREIGVPELIKENENREVFNFLNTDRIRMKTVLGFKNYIPVLMNGTLANPDVQKLLKDKTEKFDLVIINYFMNEAFIGLGVKYDCPVVMLSTVSLMHWLAKDSGNPTSPGTIPNVFLDYAEDMDITGRIVNTAMDMLEKFVGWAELRPMQNTFYKLYFPEEAKRIDFYQLKKKISVVLINSHSSLAAPRPLLPNAVEVGGYHIGKLDPLPEDIQEILNNAKNGVILFSMGSILDVNLMSRKTKHDLLKSFGSLKETVLWKSDEEFPVKPKNVVTRKWLPQTSILAHPNVKMFITHGGILSIIEAVSSGVPMLAIPIFGDQFHNAKSIQYKGNGLMLQYTNLTDTTLTWAINQILDDPKYTKKAKWMQQIFNDRPVHPRKLVSFYAEHAVRTGGAKYLSPVNPGIVSYLLLDLCLIFTVPLVILLILVKITCKEFWKRMCGAKEVQERQKKNS